MQLTITTRQVIDVLESMNLYVGKADTPDYPTDKEMYMIHSFEGREMSVIGELCVNEHDIVELFGPRMLRERFSEHKRPKA